MRSTAGSPCEVAFPLLPGMALDKFANGCAIIFSFCSLAHMVAFLLNHLLAPGFDPAANRE